MSSFDKVVKLACKPKAAPPKAKYLEPIIAATWSDDGAVHDVCKALSPRFREPNSIVVFKALIVLHTMIRNGSTDNVLGYLSSSEVLRLRNVSAGNWEGYAAPENIQNYANYLESRIRAYRDLKHDAIRVQAETNRDMRNSQSIGEETMRSRKQNPPAPSGPTRSKTIIGRKLRVMTVEKGLLRETKIVHRMIDSLVECRFYLDDLEDELTTTALRMLVKDLLILFQAGNEGVINVLEHYFEMSHVDAKEALAIYRHFCKQTERVVEFLGVAKKLQNLLNVPIPNLRHAPVSLAGALQGYLDDPNFEQNRIEYRFTRDATDGGNKKLGPNFKPEKSDTKQDEKADKPSTSTSARSTSPTNVPKPAPSSSKAVIDFFTAIEEEQPTMFNPQTNSPSNAYFQAQSVSNPFAQMQMTGQQQGQMQQTGFLHPQYTAFQPSPANPFGAQLQAQPTGHRPFSAFLPQQTGFPSQPAQQPFIQPQQTAFLQPQSTGANPFRQSMLLPQTTGMALFGVGGGMMGQPSATTPSTASSFTASSASSMDSMNPFPNFAQGSTGSNGMSPFVPMGANPAAPITAPVASSMFGSNSVPNQVANLPVRPSSTPLTSFATTSTTTSPPVAQPLKPHQTGTKNPFGPITAPPPPVPRQPTLFELSMGMGGNPAPFQPQQTQVPPASQGQTPQSSQPTGAGGFGFNSGALSAGATDMSSIASSFAFNPTSGPIGTTSNLSTTNSLGALNAHDTATTTTTTTGSAFSDSLFSSLSSQPTGATQTSSVPSISVSNPLQPQATGFAGLKPFKPTSSFGASLMESLPPIAGSPSATPSATNGTNGINYNFTGAPGTSGAFTSPTTNFMSNQIGATNIGSTVGVGLRSQMTGGGAANPFRASMATGNLLNQPSPPVPVLPNLNFSTSTSFGSNLFGSSTAFGPNQNGQQQQNGSLL